MYISFLSYPLFTAETHANMQESWTEPVYVAAGRLYFILSRLSKVPWSSGYGMRLAIWRVWVWIKAPHGHFSHWFVVKMVDVCLKMTENKRKRFMIWSVVYSIYSTVKHMQHSTAHTALFSTCSTVYRGQLKLWPNCFNSLIGEKFVLD